MQQHLPDTLALLARTPAALDSLLRHLPDTWTHAREAPDAWNALDIVGHLIHCEHTDWMPRARTILEHGDARPFDPFDRFGHVRMIEGKTLPQLLDEFALVRAAYLDEVRGWVLESKGEMTPPCGVPATVDETAPSSITPASSHCFSSLSILRSEMRRATSFISLSCSMLPK